jgi:hypothetical protein
MQIDPSELHSLKLVNQWGSAKSRPVFVKMTPTDSAVEDRHGESGSIRNHPDTKIDMARVTFMVDLSHSRFGMSTCHKEVTEKTLRLFEHVSRQPVPDIVSTTAWIWL